MKKSLVFIGIILLIVTEILRVYFIMPFPGSQYDETLDIAYWIGTNIIWIRLVFLVLIAALLMQSLKSSKKAFKIVTGSLVLLYAVIFYFFLL